MKDMQTVFDDLGWLFHEPATEFARTAAAKLDTIAADGLMVQHETAALVAVALPLAEAVTSMAHSLAHAVGLLEVIAERLAVQP